MSGPQPHAASIGKRLVPWVGIALAAMISGPTDALAHEHLKKADGIAVYLGVVPSPVVRAHAKTHLERTMHGGIPRGSNVFHVMAAVFDEASGARIENVTVTARVIPLGLAGTTRDMEPMAIGDTVTYGNYFTFPGRGYYRIEVCVMPPDGTAPITLEFAYEHRAQ